MRKISMLLAIMGFVFCSIMVTSCKDDNGGENIPTKFYDISYNDDDVSSTSVKFKVNTQGACEIATIAMPMSDADDSMDGAMIFASAEADNNVTSAEAGNNEVDVENLDGNTGYVVYFAFKTETGYLVDKQEVTTKNYDKVLTIIKADKNTIKYHIEVPEGTNYRYALITDVVSYESMKDQFFNTDVDFLTYGGFQGKGSKTVEVHDGDVLSFGDEEDEEDVVTTSIKPGSSVVLLMAECDEEGNIDAEYDYGGGGIDPGFGVDGAPAKRAKAVTGDYLTTCDDEYVTINGTYAKQYFWTEAPKEGPDKIVVTPEKLNCRSAKFRISAPESVKAYGYTVFSEEEYDYYKSFTGDKGIQAFCLENSYQGVGETELDLTGSVQPNHNYYISVVGVNDDNGYSQVWTLYKFSLMESSLAQSELQVTPVELPENVRHMYVAFNIKAVNKDSYGVRYLENYTKEWVKKKNSGYTNESLMANYGQDELSDEVIAAVNSDEGYTVTFASDANMENMLLVASYNADEALSECYEAKARTAEEPDKPYVASTLYEDLKGEWTMRYNDLTSGSVKNILVNLDQSPDQGPATWADFKATAEYTSLMKYFMQNEEKVKALYDEYKERAAHYAAKYKGQNYIVGTGFEKFISYVSYYSPWDLFCDMDYSAYDNDELFYDYGPKVFFEVVEGDNGAELVLNCDASLPPMFNNGGTFFFLPYNADNNYYLPAASFPVEVSADKNTLTINPVSANGVTYYPAAMRFYGTYPFVNTSTDEPIVLTRGNSATNSVPKYVGAAKRANGVACAPKNLMKRTQLPVVAPKAAKYVKYEKKDAKAALKAKHDKMFKK